MANLTITEIYNTVGQVIIDAWAFQLANYRPHPVGADSSLVKSFAYKTTFQERDVKTGRFTSIGLELSALDYARFLDAGRKPLARKVPIAALIVFIKKRRLQQKFRKSSGRFQSVNQIAFLLQNSIYKKGIAPRRFIFAGLEEGERKLSMLIDRDLLDILTAEIVSFYKP